MYSFRKSASTNRNLARLGKGQRVAILFDCNSRIQLYAVTVITGSQLVDRRVMRERLIQNAARYPNIFSNETWIKKRGENKRFVWKNFLPLAKTIAIEIWPVYVKVKELPYCLTVTVTYHSTLLQ